MGNTFELFVYKPALYEKHFLTVCVQTCSLSFCSCSRVISPAFFSFSKAISKCSDSCATKQRNIVYNYYIPNPHRPLTSTVYGPERSRITYFGIFLVHFLSPVVLLHLSVTSLSCSLTSSFSLLNCLHLLCQSSSLFCSSSFSC